MERPAGQRPCWPPPLPSWLMPPARNFLHPLSRLLLDLRLQLGLLAHSQSSPSRPLGGRSQAVHPESPLLMPLRPAPPGLLPPNRPTPPRRALGSRGRPRRTFFLSPSSQPTGEELLWTPPLPSPARPPGGTLTGAWLWWNPVTRHLAAGAGQRFLTAALDQTEDLPFRF